MFLILCDIDKKWRIMIVIAALVNSGAGRRVSRVRGE